MSEEEAPVSSSSKMVLAALGYAIPGGLIVMLGFLGIAFLMDSNKRLGAQRQAEREAEAKQQQASLSQPDPVVAPAPGGGSADAGGGEADMASVMKEGGKNYATCAACHGPDGKGMQMGPQKMAPTLVGSEITLGDPDRMALVIMKGVFREPTSEYVGMMAPLEAAFDDKQLASVMTYVRQSFGNEAGLVTPEMVASAREKYQGVNAPGGVKREAIDQVAAGQ
jgi:mono/diheme cytochrome c family protein